MRNPVGESVVGQGNKASQTDLNFAPRVEWREIKGGLGWFSSGKGRWDSARFQPRTPDTGWKPMLCYATMLSGVSSDLSKFFSEVSSAHPTATTRRYSVVASASSLCGVRDGQHLGNND